MRTVQPAQVYEAAADLWILTSHFNPLGYESRLRNYETFRHSLQASGLRLITVECAFGNASFQLAQHEDVVRVRARDVMWQKERLLNLALEQLPSRCTKVAWVDGDVLFENPRWAAVTSELLERHAVVQPFETIARLLRDGTIWEDDRWTRGFAATYRVDRSAVRSADMIRHGDTGLAWAARREVLGRHGLYDRAIAGGADHLMAHAMCGDLGSGCLDRLLGVHTPHRSDAQRWGQELYAGVRGDIACVTGTACHLWHGDYGKRNYGGRKQMMLSFGFDPVADLRLGREGCWEWATAKPELHTWVREYFAQRDEDGGASPGA